jgi:hypothetical protein
MAANNRPNLSEKHELWLRLNVVSRPYPKNGDSDAQLKEWWFERRRIASWIRGNEQRKAARNREQGRQSQSRRRPASQQRFREQQPLTSIRSR